MSHEIETMFSVRETPWHGLGTIVQDAPTTAEAIKLAGLDWRVTTTPLYMVNEAGANVPVEAAAVIRQSDKRILGHHVGAKWTPLQNADAFKWFDPLIESGDCRFETAGSLREGQRVWILAAINKPAAVIGPDDEVKSFLLLSNSHDGSLAVRVGFTPIRVVCANTLAIAHNDHASKLLRIRHTKNIGDAMLKLRDTINMLTEEFTATADQYRFLASRGVNREDLRKYVKIVLNLSDSKDENAAAGELTTRSKNILAAVLERFDSGYGAKLPSAKGTWWGAYNAITEYLSYNRGRTTDTRIDGLWFGDGAATNREALKLAVSLAA